MQNKQKMNRPRFTFLVGDVNWRDYGGKWISQRMNNGDFDFWYVIDFLNMDEACGRDNFGKPRYHVTLLIVSPSEAGDENMKKAAECCGCEEIPPDPRWQVEMLASYGISAFVGQWSGNNAAKLLQEAKKEAQINSGFTFGFSMDRAQNKIGTTGWEALKGDITAGLYRTIDSGSQEGQILAKMHGISTEQPKPETP